MPQRIENIGPDPFPQMWKDKYIQEVTGENTLPEKPVEPQKGRNGYLLHEMIMVNCELT